MSLIRVDQRASFLPDLRNKGLIGRKAKQRRMVLFTKSLLRSQNILRCLKGAKRSESGKKSFVNKLHSLPVNGKKQGKKFVWGWVGEYILTENTSFCPSL